MKSVIAGALLLTAAVTVSEAASAQNSRADTVHLRERCRLMRQVLTSGNPARMRAWALRTLPRCGSQGGDIVSEHLMRAAVGRGDEKALGELLDASLGFQDASILTAALALASSGLASVPVRVMGIRFVFAQVEPEADAPPEWFVSESSDDGAVTYIIDIGVRKGTPLAPDASRKAADQLWALANDATTPPLVRRAAGRVALSAELQARRRERCTPEMEPRECSARITREQPR